MPCAVGIRRNGYVSGMRKVFCRFTEYLSSRLSSQCTDVILPIPGSVTQNPAQFISIPRRLAGRVPDLFHQFDCKLRRYKIEKFTEQPIGPVVAAAVLNRDIALFD